MTGLMQDFRYALRQLRKSPGFTAVAILSLALGIGANTAIFTLIHGLLLKSLPVNEPQHLVAFGAEAGGGEVDGMGPGPLDIFPYEFYKQIAQQPQESFQGIAGYGSFPVTVSVKIGSNAGGSAGAATSQAISHLVSGNFFSVLGAEPILGRAIAPSDDAPGRDPVAVISYRYWQQVLSGDSTIIGKPLTINGTLFTVIGVMPPKFFGVEVNEESPDMWLPLAFQEQVMLQPSLLGPHGLYWMHLMGRRQPGTNLAKAQAVITSQLQRYMMDREGVQPSSSRAQEIQKIFVPLLPGGRGISHLREQYSQPLNILMGAVAMVLLIACANLANFLLARAAAREREISTRLALGATRGRIMRQILTEALLLSVCGGALGLVLAFWGTRTLISFVVGGAAHTPLAASPDLAVLGFTIAIALVTGILFGIVPAVRISKIGTASAMNASARTAVSSGGRSGRLLPKVLVTAQVMVSLVLLAGAGLLVRTLRNLQNQDFGFDRHHLLLVEFNAKFAGYKAAQLNGLYETMLARLDALPSVRSASISGGVLMSGGSWNSPIFIEGRTASPNENLSTLLNRVGPRYFETIGMPVLRGRAIDADDSANARKVVVVNQALADHFFPQGDAIGHRFKVADPSVKGEWEIVGIVRDAKYNGPREEQQRMVYLPVMQLTEDDNYAYWLQVQTSQDPALVAGAVRTALAQIDPNLPVLDIKTVGEQVDLRMDNERFISQLSSFFSLLALLLACIGLYGVMNYDVARRTNEIGVRMALGAQTSGVMWLVLKESMVLLIIGLALGLPAAVAATRMLQSQLFGLSPHDPATFALAVFAVAIVTLFAAYFPALRAAKVDPMVALRYE
jgi:predicted permease